MKKLVDTNGFVFVVSSLTYIFVPAVRKLGVVGQAALHHVAAVVAAGSDGGQTLTCGTGGHLGQGLGALVTRRDLDNLGQHLLTLVQSLGKSPGRHETPTQLECQLFGHVTEWLELLHVLTDALEIPKK